MSDPSAGDAESGDASSALGAEHPRTIGPYRLLRVLGEGGIGLVYLADQSEPVRRRVALKVIKVGMDTRQVVARFESERQALAVMDHPNIAHVLDAGAAENGRPYFVMEHVQGVPITDYCDTHRLSTDDRVHLFLDVCAAIQHAHQKGVVHRDLKPSNLLVGVEAGKPRVKVIDFGIAKAMGQGLTERTLVTRVGQLLGTPAYMSPEQAEMSGVDVDTRTDIYSLGVVLYELLTGALPIDLDRVPEHALPHALRDTEVPTPSARLTTLGDASDAIARHRSTDLKRLRRELRGDLDWIVARAMEKDRTRRYETVEALAADLRRHLDHVPVLARPRSAGYVLARFIRRHKAAVAAGAIAILALALGAVLATAGFVRATRAEQGARREAQTALRTAEFMVDLFEVSDPSEARGNTITAREILDRGAERIRTELADQPDVQSNLMNTIGTVYAKLGLFAESRAILEQSLAIRRKTFGDRSPQALESMVSLGESLYLSGDVKSAEPILRDALALGEALHIPGNIPMAEAMSDLGVALASPDRRERVEAIELQRKALDIYLRERGPNDPAIAVIEGNLANALMRHQEFEEAERLKRHALALAERLHGPDSPEAAGHRLGLAEILVSRSKLAEAEEQYRAALAISQKTLGEQHPKVANNHRNLGLLLLYEEHYAEAEAQLRDALSALSATYPAGNNRTARVQSELALALMLMDRHAEAEQEMRAAAAMVVALSDAPDRALVQARFADLLVAVGKYDEASVVAEQARGSERASHRAYAVSAEAAALAALGRRGDAEALREQLLPPEVGPFILDRLAMQRIFALYARWATPAELDALQAEAKRRVPDGEQIATGAPTKDKAPE